MLSSFRGSSFDICCSLQCMTWFMAGRTCVSVVCLVGLMPLFAFPCSCLPLLSSNSSVEFGGKKQKNTRQHEVEKKRVFSWVAGTLIVWFIQNILINTWKAAVHICSRLRAEYLFTVNLLNWAVISTAGIRMTRLRGEFYQASNLMTPQPPFPAQIRQIVSAELRQHIHITCGQRMKVTRLAAPAFTFYLHPLWLQPKSLSRLRVFSSVWQIFRSPHFVLEPLCRARFILTACRWSEPAEGQ